MLVLAFSAEGLSVVCVVGCRQLQNCSTITMRRSVLAVLPQLLRANAAASSCTAPLQHLSSKLQQLRAFADDASLKVCIGQK